MTAVCSTTVLESLIDEPMSQCRARESSAFERAAKGCREAVIFGAGGLGRKAPGILRDAGVEPLAFADDKLAGSALEGLPVLAPAEAIAAYGRSAVFVVAIPAPWNDAGAQMARLRRSGCATVVPFNFLLWRRPDLLPHAQVELPSRLLEQREEILRSNDLWSDDGSREEFAAQLHWRLYADYERLATPANAANWQSDIAPAGREAVYVDGGACGGETIEQFLEAANGEFSRIYAFEPDLDHFVRLTQRVGRLPRAMFEKIDCFCAGLSDRMEQIPFRHGRRPGAEFGGECAVVCGALDELLEEPPTLIKLDIGGFELRALAGAARAIASHAPTLAVCTEHAADHLWKIPLMIHSLNPEYRLHLRAHTETWGTVCYASRPPGGWEASAK